MARPAVGAWLRQRRMLLIPTFALAAAYYILVQLYTASEMMRVEQVERRKVRDYFLGYARGDASKPCHNDPAFCASPLVIGVDLEPSHWTGHGPFVPADNASEHAALQCNLTTSELRAVCDRHTEPSAATAPESLAAAWPLDDFSPRTPGAGQWTDLAHAFDASGEELSDVLTTLYCGDERITTQCRPDRLEKLQAKRRLNDMMLWLNRDTFAASIAEDHVPLWMRVYRRTDPLCAVFGAMRHVEHINETVLFVTIDGEYSDVLDAIMEVDFMAVRLFWHDASWEKDYFPRPERPPRNIIEHKWREVNVAVNAHFVYGMRLLVDVFGYPYVATMEDDVAPSPDYYLFHKALHKHTYTRRYMAVQCVPQGPFHDCHFIESKLLNLNGTCSALHMRQVTAERYYCGWGAGLPQKVLWPVVKALWATPAIVYDGVLAQLAAAGSMGRAISPCAPRCMILENGVNGPSRQRWDEYIPLLRDGAHGRGAPPYAVLADPASGDGDDVLAEGGPAAVVSSDIAVLGDI